MFKKYCLIFLLILSFLYRIESFSGCKEIPTTLAFNRCSQKHSQEPLNPVEPVMDPEAVEPVLGYGTTHTSYGTTSV